MLGLPRRLVVYLCEFLLTRYEGRWALFQKGVCLKLAEAQERRDPEYEWDQWEPMTSPNAEGVVKTFLPPFTGAKMYLECQLPSLLCLEFQDYGLGCGSMPLSRFVVEDPHIGR